MLRKVLQSFGGTFGAVLHHICVAGLYATPCRGVASHALGLWQCTETKAQIRMLTM